MAYPAYFIFIRNVITINLLDIVSLVFFVNVELNLYLHLHHHFFVAFLLFYCCLFIFIGCVRIHSIEFSLFFPQFSLCQCA